MSTLRLKVPSNSNKHSSISTSTSSASMTGSNSPLMLPMQISSRGFSPYSRDSLQEMDTLASAKESDSDVVYCYPDGPNVNNDHESGCRYDSDEKDPNCNGQLIRTDNDDAYCYPDASIKHQVKKDDGRLFQEFPLYCEGLEKPMFRGIGHLICTCLLPFGMWHLVLEANGNFLGTIIAVLYVGSNIFCYGFSSLLHVGRWSAKTEIFIQKMDHCGIAILSCGTMLPVSCLLLETKVGMLFTFLSVSSCAWTCYNILKLRPSALRQLITAAVLLPFIPFCWPRMNAIEFRSMITCCVLQFLGMQVFTRGCPDLWPKIFGYHEVFHTLVIASGVCVYLCNWSVIRRTCNPYAHRTEIIDVITDFFNMEHVGWG